MRPVPFSINTICFITGFLISLSCGGAQNPIDALLVKSGLDSQVRQYPAIISTAMDHMASAQSEKVPPNFVLMMDQAVKSSYDVDAMLAEIREYLENNLTADEIGAVLKWLDSPPGKKISRLEKAAARPEAFLEMQKMSAEMTPSRSRMILLNQLDTALRSTESSLNLAINSQAAVMTAMTAAMSPEEKLSFDTMVAAFRKKSGPLRTQVQTQVRAALMYTYRGLKEAELKEYIAFALSDAGRQYHLSASESLNIAVMRASMKLGDRIVEDIRKLHQGAPPSP